MGENARPDPFVSIYVCERGPGFPLEDVLLYDPGCSADVRLPCKLVADNEALPDAGAS